MPEKKYKKDSLYFTDRKAYYEQKKIASKSDTKSQSFDFLNMDSDQYEQAVGFCGSGWTNNGTLRGGIDTGDSALSTRFPNLTGNGSLYKNTNGYISIQESIWLCQKAWEEFQLFRNTIEAMVEFSLSEIKLSSTNKSAKNFCEAWIKSVGMRAFSEQFYREMYRSCNIFVHKINGKVKPKSLTSLKSMSGGDKNIPVKYTILNPAQIAIEGGITSESSICKVLSPYEVKRLKDPKTPSEKNIYSNLDPKIKEKLKSSYSYSSADPIYISLKDVDAIFYQKQDYECFAVPLFYGVLDDIELKLEMKKADRRVMATVESMILLVTMGGAKGKDNQEMPANPEHMRAMRQIFENKRVQRHLVADHTTEVSYIIPDINKVVGKDKYEQVNEDIREGLQSIFGSNEKFSNSMTKVKVFCERLKSGQAIFKEYIDGELEIVSEEMGYSEAPTATLSSIDLEDPTQANRVYTRMAELGYLTPQELNQAIEVGILPTKEESLESQVEFKKAKDMDLYIPQLNHTGEEEVAPDASKPEKKGSKKEPGRPTGSGGPNSAQRAPRVTGSVETISIKAVQDIFGEYGELEKAVASEIKKTYKVEELKEGHIDLANSLSKQIISNYPKEDWASAAATVVKNQEVVNNYDMIDSIGEICDNFELDNFHGSLIYHTQK